MKITEKEIFNIILRTIQEQEFSSRKTIDRKPNREPKRDRRRKDREKEFSSSSVAPGHQVFRACVDNPSQSLTALPGPEVVFFIEDAPGWNGNGGAGSSPSVGYDSWANSGSLMSSISTNWNVGQVGDIIINGVSQGCHEYAGTSSGSFINRFFNSTINPVTQDPIPASVSVGILHNNCTGCVYGGTDPGGPTFDDAILDDSEDVMENYTKTKIKKILKDFS